MTRSTILVAVTAVVFAGVIANFATAGPYAKHSEHLSYRNVNTVVLENTQGHIHITAARGTGHVTVARTTKTLFTRATSSAYMGGGVLHLESRCHGTVCQVDYRISTPAGVRLQITQRNATVLVDGRPGNLAVTNTDSGDLNFNFAKAPQHLRATTHDGGIKINVPRGTYAVTAHAPNGDKTITGITVNQNAKHTVTASADSGDITINGR